MIFPTLFTRILPFTTTSNLSIRGLSHGDGAGTNSSKDMVKVFCRKKVVGLVWRTGEVALLGVEFGVVDGSSAHAVDEINMRKIWLYQMLYPDVKW